MNPATGPGATPRASTTAAETTRDSRIDTETSWAAAAPSLRGRARKPIPNALTKVSRARPAVSATTPIAAGSSTANRRSVLASPWIRDCSSTHSATNPTEIGSAAAPSAPTPNEAEVTGIRGPSPPSRSRSRSPLACRIAPAPRKRTVLKAAWLTTSSAAASAAIAPISGRPDPVKSWARAIAVTMSPTFSVVE